jgi:uroporphyrinogen decarboxylase
MTKRERLLTVLKGGVPDCVPVCPDISNAVPARLTGKPFYNIYAFQDPPLWKAQIAAIKHFDLDGGTEIYSFGDLYGDGPKYERRVVKRNPDGSLITQDFYPDTGEWAKNVYVHFVDDVSAYDVSPDKVGLPPVPSEWEPLTGVKEWPKGFELWKMVKRELGDHGILGMPCGAHIGVVHCPELVYEYYENPKATYARRDAMIERAERNFKTIAALDDKPDFVFAGCSGSLVFQTPEMFQELSLPVLKRVCELAAALGIFVHVHSCGPQKEMVRMIVENNIGLTVIDPLENPPMGDCDLADLKKRFGDRIVLKGNLHTTDVMLRGSVEDVIAASKKAIDDAAAGGRFILSSGDQCGRDTPDENIHAMVETARTYGRYENGKPCREEPNREKIYRR